MKLDPSGVYIYMYICIYAISFQIWYFRMGGPMLYVYIYIYDGNIAGVSLISNWSTPLKVSSNTFFGCSILLFLLRVVWTFNTCNPVSDCVSHTIYIGSDWGHHATYIYIYLNVCIYSIIYIYNMNMNIYIYNVYIYNIHIYGGIYIVYRYSTYETNWNHQLGLQAETGWWGMTQTWLPIGISLILPNNTVDTYILGGSSHES